MKVFVQISKEPLFTIGRDAFLNQVLLKAGGQSATDDVPSGVSKTEQGNGVSQLQPDAIILSDSTDNQEPNEVFKDSPAVKNGRVYKINADIFSRPGPRLSMHWNRSQKILHPEKFQ